MNKDTRLEMDMAVVRKRYQHIVDKMVDYYPVSSDEIKIIMNDGKDLIYNVVMDKMRWAVDRRDNMKNFPDETSYRKTVQICLGSIMRMRRVSRQELSDITGLSEVSISKYLNGKATPTLYHAEKIARALDCSVSDFYKI